MKLFTSLEFPLMLLGSKHLKIQNANNTYLEVICTAKERFKRMLIQPTEWKMLGECTANYKFIPRRFKEFKSIAKTH